MNNLKKYKSPELEIVYFDDVITSSLEEESNDGWGPLI